MMKKLMVFVLLVVFVVLVVKYMMFLHERDMKLLEAYEVCVAEGKCN